MHAGKIESCKLQIAQALDILKKAIETIREAQEYNPDEENNGCCSKDKTGKICKSQKWYLDIRDQLQIRHKIPAFTDKRQSESFGRQIEKLVNLRGAGEEPDMVLSA